jgi:dTDP-4-amino-4,6-dideoxygalactose transaminase
MFPGGNRIGAAEETAVAQVLKSKRLFRYYGVEPGPSVVERFEGRFAGTMGVRRALAVNSGTAALATAMAALGVGPGDQVIVPAYSWISTASAAVVLGAVPVLAEVDESLTIDVADAEGLVTPHTKAVVPVHMRGAPCNMAAMTAMAERQGLAVLEDVAQAVGGSYRGRRLGSLGQIGIYSLQFNKIITCGEGGVVVTDDDRLYARALLFHDVAATQRTRLEGVSPFVALTCRLSELQGAVADVQLDRLDGIIEDCRRNRATILGEVGSTLKERGIVLRRSHDETGDTGIALVLLCPDVPTGRSLTEHSRQRGLPAKVLFDPEVPDFHVAYHWGPILNRASWTPRGAWSNPDSDAAYNSDRWRRTIDILGRAVHFDVSPDLTAEQAARYGRVLREGLEALP